MTTIAVSEQTKQKINMYGRKGETYEAIINRLLDEKGMPLSDSRAMYQTENKSPRTQESYSNFLFKIQQVKMQELWDNKDDEEWENA
jgi:hypothetical protein